MWPYELMKNLPLTMDNAAGHFEQFGKTIHKYEVGWYADQPPPIVYHYTNPIGLEGILRTGEFWATDHRFCNDRSEYEYGCEIARKEAERVLSANPSKIARAVFETLLKHLSETPSAFAFLVCFSEEGDLLGQWRSYGTHPVKTAGRHRVAPKHSNRRGR